MFQQLSDDMCKRMRKDHVPRTLTYIPLREVVAIFGQKSRETQPQLGATGKVLKLKKQAINNNFGATGPLFLSVLKTLLYAYVLCSMKGDVDSQFLTRIPFVGMVF